MVILDGYTLWLYFMVILQRCPTLWLYLMVILYGYTLWLYLMVILDGYT